MMVIDANKFTSQAGVEKGVRAHTLPPSDPSHRAPARPDRFVSWNPIVEPFEKAVPVVAVVEKEMTDSARAGIEGAGQERRVTAAVMKSLQSGEMPTKQSVKKGIAAQCGVPVNRVTSVVDRVVGLSRVMKDIGINEELIAQKLREGLEAKDTKIATFEGQITDSVEVVAWGERRAYLDMVIRLRGDYPKEELKVDVTQRIIRLPAKKAIGEGAKVVDVEATFSGDSSDVSADGASVVEPESAPAVSP